MAKLTLWGIRDYYKEIYNVDIFDSIVLPTSNNISVANLKTYTYNCIIAHGGEFGVIYPDPVLFMEQIEYWSRGRLPVWQRTLNALELEYDPISNYDRKEEWHDTDAGIIKREDKSQDINTQSNAIENIRKITGDNTMSATGQTTNDIDNTETGSVSAYNVSTFSPERQTVTDANVTETNMISQTEGQTRDESENSSGSQMGKSDRTADATETRNLAHGRTGRAWGNIGVTTSQQMLESEIEIAKISSIFEIIADDFIRQFCIMVY